jgi:hypothetical protein
MDNVTEKIIGNTMLDTPSPLSSNVFGRRNKKVLIYNILLHCPDNDIWHLILIYCFGEIGVWSLNSGLHTLKAGALPVEAHLQSILL